MYAAPLNYDRFFRKVFSDVHIAKFFLEDFLDKTIEEIELLPQKHKITDAAALVEFDFRCKINGQYLIIDMQQWYKPDVVKRFYVYQALIACLQLETLAKKELVTKLGKKYEIKSYDGILPTFTLIWLADDTLNFEIDCISFVLLPEQTTDFLKNDALWASENFEKINAERQKILTLLNNNTKGLDFLPKNRLTFAFQKNIIKNPVFNKYKIWFEFAETTKNPNNEEQDFEKFKEKEVLMAVLERIKTNDFNIEDRTILQEWESDFLRLAEYWSDADDMVRTAQEQLRTAQEQLRTAEEKARATEEKARATEEKEHVLEHKITEALEIKIENTVLTAHQQGLDINLIATITQLPIEKVKAIIEKNKDTSGR